MPKIPNGVGTGFDKIGGTIGRMASGPANTIMGGIRGAVSGIGGSTLNDAAGITEGLTWATGRTVRGTGFGLRALGRNIDNSMLGGIGNGLGTGIAEAAEGLVKRGIAKTAPNWLNLYTGYKVKPGAAWPLAIGLGAAAAFGGWSKYEKQKAIGTMSYAGNLPALSYDFNANADRMTGTQDFGAAAAPSMSTAPRLAATGDLVLALNRLR